MEADNLTRLVETRQQLQDCGYIKTDLKEYQDVENLKSMEWWVHDDDQQQILIVVGDQYRFNLFLFIGDTSSTTKNFQAIAAIAFSKQSQR
jgi:hypothetical protein